MQDGPLCRGIWRWSYTGCVFIGSVMFVYKMLENRTLFDPHIDLIDYKVLNVSTAHSSPTKGWFTLHDVRVRASNDDYLS